MTVAWTQRPPITDDDATIEAALREAYVPLLMVTLVHLTGDASILRGSIRPNAEFSTFLGEPQGGISEEDQARIRALALDALRAYRDRGGPLPPPPSDEVVHEMMHFLIGQPLSADYVEFLTAELALDGRDAYAHPLEAVPAGAKEQFHV